MDCCLGSTFLISTMTGLRKTEKKIKLWSPSHLFQQSPVCFEQLTALWIHLQGKGQRERARQRDKGRGEGSEVRQVCSEEGGCKQITVVFPAQCHPLHSLQRMPRAPGSRTQQGRALRAESRTGPADGSPDTELRSLSTPDLARAAWAAVYRVAQSRTWLKWLSSSSSRG